VVPIIDVYTSGTDWPTIVTGAVGIAGIAATYLQSRSARRAAATDLTTSLSATASNLATTITAEARRAEWATKRTVYSLFLASLDEVALARAVERAAPDDPSRHAVVVTAVGDVFRRLAELRLTAPFKIRAQGWAVAMTVVRGASGISTDGSDDSEHQVVMDTRALLENLMRADLGVVDAPGSLADTKVDFGLSVAGDESE
jgi:hypothetical protein